jgi:hypothetical protein
MTMATIDERIASLELKLQQEKAKRSQIEARKRSAAKKKQHAEDTRRKILVGAMVLNMVDIGAWPKSGLNRRLDAYLTRDDDRALFGLAPLPKNQASNTSDTHESTD